MSKAREPELPEKDGFSLSDASGLLSYCQGAQALSCDCGHCVACAVRAFFETLWGNQGRQAIESAMDR